MKIKTIRMILVAGLVAGSGIAHAAEKSARPNIVFIISDDHQPDAKPELYDLKADLWEKKDMSAAQPERLAKMLKQLDQWWQPETK